MVQILNLPFFKNVAKRNNEKMRRENGKRIKASHKIDLKSRVVLRPETKGGLLSGVVKPPGTKEGNFSLLGLPCEITL
jgi:hypothetical protein